MSQTLEITPRTDSSPTTELLRLALPIILLTVSRMMMGFIDFVMVSQLGTAAQAAISPATILVFTIACLGMGAAQSVQTFVSQADGRGESEQGGGYAWQSYYIAAAAALLAWPVAATTPIWLGWFARAAQHAPEVRGLEVAYVHIALWSVGPATICAGLNGFFNGAQRPYVGLWAILASIVVNIFGNWLLIFGHWGFPEMGIAGAAIATVIGWCVRAAILMYALCAPSFDRKYKTRTSWAPSWPKLAGILRIGGPTAVQWLVDIGAWVMFMSLIVPLFGTVAMAASNVALQYMHLSFMPAVGVGIALCSQVGFAIGESQPEKAYMRARIAMRFTGIYMGAIGVLFVVARGPLMTLMSSDPDVIQAGAVVLIWAAIFQVFDAMGITYMNALRGAGDTRWPAIVIGLCCWGIFIGGGYSVSRLLPQWGLHGPWAICALYICVVGIALWARFRSGVWQKIRLFDKPEREVPPPIAEPDTAVGPGPLPAE